METTNFILNIIVAVLLAYLLPFILVFLKRKSQLRHFHDQLWQQSKEAIENSRQKDYVIADFYLGTNKYFVASPSEKENIEKITYASEKYNLITTLTINIL